MPRGLKLCKNRSQQEESEDYSRTRTLDYIHTQHTHRPRYRRIDRQISQPTLSGVNWRRVTDFGSLNSVNTLSPYVPGQNVAPLLIAETKKKFEPLTTTQITHIRLRILRYAPGIKRLLSIFLISLT